LLIAAREVAQLVQGRRGRHKSSRKNKRKKDERFQELGLGRAAFSAKNWEGIYSIKRSEKKCVTGKKPHPTRDEKEGGKSDRRQRRQA